MSEGEGGEAPPEASHEAYGPAFSIYLGQVEAEPAFEPVVDWEEANVQVGSL